jgi:hypothetical protein
MKTLLIIISLTVFLFASCKKDQIQVVNFPQVVFLSKLNVKTSFKVYTKDGEITNSMFINEFKSSPLFNKLETKTLDPSENITFLSADSAVFGASNTKFNIVKNDDQLLFYSPLIAQGSYNNPIYDIPKYSSEKISVTQNNFDYLTKQVRVAYGNYRSLNVSKLSYLLKSGNTIYQSGTLLNELNENISKKLKSTDTLAVQEYTLSFKAK